MATAATASCDDCGWTGGPSRSPAQADYALSRHSCDRWKAKAASAQRGRARAAAVDRTPKPCHHPQAEHQHGTHACYVLDRCRCHPCTNANAAYEKNRLRQTAYGRFNPFVPAGPVRDHVQALMAAGMGAKTIAARAGVSYSTLGRLLYGRGGTGPRRFEPPSTKLRKETAQALLAVTATVNTLAPGARIDNTGTRRRLQALMAIGWSQTKLAGHLGYEVRNFNHLVHGKRAVTVATARKVTHLYEQLWDTTPPQATRWDRGAANRARSYAHARGWAPPMAWDDDSIDDPHATPDTGQPTPISNGPRNRLHLEDLQWLLDQQTWTRPGIAARLGTSWDAIEKACYRAGRADLIARIPNTGARRAS